MSLLDILSALFGKRKGNKEVSNIALEEIQPNPFQPRRKFNENSLKELAHSISEYGVIQPVLLRKAKHQEGYEIVTGERRVRASKLAGLSTVPAIIGTFTDLELIEIAFIENLQRENLDVLEEAKSYDIIRDEFKSLSIEDIAMKLGKSTEEIREKLTFLSLPVILQEALALGMITKQAAEKLKDADAEDKQLQHLKENFHMEFALREIEKVLKERLQFGLEGTPLERKHEIMKGFLQRFGGMVSAMGWKVIEETDGIKIVFEEPGKMS